MVAGQVNLPLNTSVFIHHCNYAQITFLWMQPTLRLTTRAFILRSCYLLIHIYTCQLNLSGNHPGQCRDSAGESRKVSRFLWDLKMLGDRCSVFKALFSVCTTFTLSGDSASAKSTWIFTWSVNLSFLPSMSDLGSKVRACFKLFQELLHPPFLSTMMLL